MLTYKDAGVNIDETTAVKRQIARMVRSTYSPQVLSEIGLFGSLYQLKGYRQPVLVASCDSVGTKLMVARMMGKHDTVGEDIVNHSVNDILTLGAKPLFFLDYVAFADLPSNVIPDVIKGLVRGCKRNGCALIGGETAMLPGLYPKGDYDLAGTIVGVVEKKDIINPKRIRPGDVLLGLPSTGLHTNGYSLARKVLFEKLKLKKTSPLPACIRAYPGAKTTVGEALLKVHRSYRPLLLPWLKQVKALAHITGGGFYENIERLLPRNVSVVIYKDAWKPLPIFRAIQEGGSVPEQEMYRVFNMGIGMVVICTPAVAEAMLTRVKGTRVIGETLPGNGKVTVV
jgi:phosphoribosylformylglycinamidine cyclo-ligase